MKTTLTTTILLCNILLVVMLTGCVAKPAPIPSEQTPPSIELLSNTTCPPSLATFDVCVRITVDRTVWTHVVQEVETSDGWTLVECWPASDPDTRYDRHVGTIPGWRVCRVYGANVEGVDCNEAGFAHLPNNLAGTFKTNVPPELNARYQRAHKTTGQITRAGGSIRTWVIMAGGRIVEVVIPRG